MLSNSKRISLSDSQSRLGMSTIRCNDWHEFLDLTYGLAKSQVSFESYNWSNLENESEMDMSSDTTQASFNCSTVEDFRDDLELVKRQRLNMNKHIQLLNFLESLDSNWEVTTEYESDYYKAYGSRDVLHESEDIRSDIVMVPTDFEDAHALQAGKHASLLFTRCCRTLEYMNELDPDEWEIKTPTDLNGSFKTPLMESTNNNEISSFHMSSDDLILQSSQNRYVSTVNKNIVRSLDIEFQNISEEQPLIIPSSSVEDDIASDKTTCQMNEFDSMTSENDFVIPSLNSSSWYPSKSIEISHDSTQHNKSEYHKQSSEIQCHTVEAFCEQSTHTLVPENNPIPNANIKAAFKVSVADKISSMEIIVNSPDDPLGAQHLKWHESSSPSDTVLTPAITTLESAHKSGVDTTNVCLQPITEKMRFFRQPHQQQTSVVSLEKVQHSNEGLKGNNSGSTQTSANESAGFGAEISKTTVNNLDKASANKMTVISERCTHPKTDGTAQDVVPVVSKTTVNIAIATQESNIKDIANGSNQTNQTQNCTAPNDYKDFEDAIKISEIEQNSPQDVEMVSQLETSLGTLKQPPQLCLLSTIPSTPIAAHVEPVELMIPKKLKSALKPAKPIKMVRHDRSFKRKRISTATTPTTAKKVQFTSGTAQVVIERENSYGLRTRSILNKKSSTPVNVHLDPYDLSHIDDDGDTTFENLFEKRVSTPKASIQKTKKKAKQSTLALANKPEDSPCSEASTDSTQLQILSILQETKQKFYEAANKNRRKIEKEPKAVVEPGTEKLKEIVETVVKEVIRSMQKSRVHKKYRRYAPSKKIILKKVYVPKRNPCEDKAVQVFFTCEKSTNTEVKVIEKDAIHVSNLNNEKPKTNAEITINVDKCMEKAKKSKRRKSNQTERNKTPHKSRTRRPAKPKASAQSTSISENLLSAKCNNKTQNKGHDLVDKAKIIARKTIMVDAVNFNVNDENIQRDNFPKSNGNDNRLKQTTLSQYLQNEDDPTVQQTKPLQRAQDTSINSIVFQPKSTKGCYRITEQFLTQTSNASCSSSSTLKPGTIYCPNATIILANKDHENSFFKRIDKLCLSDVHSDSSHQQVIQCSQTPNDRRFRLKKRQSRLRLKPVCLDSSSDTPQLSGVTVDPDVYPEEYGNYIADRILADHRNRKLKTLADLYGERAFEIGTHEIDYGLLFLNGDANYNQISGDSGLIITGTSRDESGEQRTNEADAEYNHLRVNSNDQRNFCSTVKGSQEPIRFSPGLSPIRYN